MCYKNLISKYPISIYSDSYKLLKKWETKAYIATKDHKFEQRIMIEEINQLVSFIKRKRLANEL